MGHFTSIEQGKKLIKAGLNPDTADMCYKCICDEPYDIVVKPYSYWKEQYKGLLMRNDVKVLPCWSAGRLIELMQNILFATPNTTCTKYHCYGFDGQLTEIFGDTVIDVLVDMALHCLKEGIIKKGE